jgi:hypothetical protein
MTIPRVTITVNDIPIKRYIHKLRNGSPAGRKTLNEWAKIQREFLYKRYERYSEGGGDWEPLKEKTILQKLKKGLLPFILRATDTMMESLNPHNPGVGSYTKIHPNLFKVVVGFNTFAGHPMSKKTIGRLAEIHHEGRGRVPVREVVEEPDRATINKMKKVAQHNFRIEASLHLPPGRNP